MTDALVAAPEPQDDSDEQKPCAWCGDVESDVQDGRTNLNGDTVFRSVLLCESCFWFAEREDAVDRVNRKYEKLTTEKPRPAIF
jgi:hypothetical protein